MDRTTVRCHCPHCCRPLPVSGRVCPGCGLPVIEGKVLSSAVEASEELAREWANSPYFRAANRNAYTLRARTRGFSDSEDSLLARAVSNYLEKLARSCNTDEWPFLAHRAISGELFSRASALALWVDAFRRRHESRLVARCRKGKCPPMGPPSPKSD